MTSPELKLLHRYQKLIDLSRDLASTLDLDLLLDRIVNAAAELTDSEAASILLTSDENNSLYFQAASNLDRPFMRGLAVPVDSSIAGWIVKNRSPLIVDDPQNDPRYFSEIQQLSKVTTRNLLGVPLIVKDRVVGVLEAINKRQDSFNVEDEEILLILGAQAAVAIENARLFTQSDLIAEVIHELRTPLSSLNAAAYLLLRPDLPKEEHNEIVSIILNESRRLTEMTSHFLDFARLESGRMEFEAHTIEVPILLGECIGIMKSQFDEKSIKLIWQVPENLPDITGDPDRLKQAFLNLISNAVKYNKENGTVVIGARAVENQLTVSFKDSGIGITEEEQKNLFGKFYRAPGTEDLVPGSGLGLSIVKRIVQAHGGDVAVESAAGKGSTFTVHLPLKPQNV